MLERGGGAATAKRADGGRPAGYHRQTKDLGNALVMTVPLLVVYSVGLFAVDSNVLNGADLFTRALFQGLGASGYLIFQAALLVLALGAAVVLRKHGRFHWRHFPLLLGESLLYALSMGTIILFIMREARLVGPTGVEVHGVLDTLVLSAGAGFHEELVFRLLMLSGLALFLKRMMPKQGWLAVGIAIAVTSVLFSAAHYVGPTTFEWYTFWYRILAGVFFAILYVARGFAVAAYSHALYDVYVILF